MSIPRSQSVPHFTSASFQYTKTSIVATATAPGVADHHVHPKLPRHRSAIAVSATKHLASVYTPRVEREDPFSLSGFFPAKLPPHERSVADQGSWEWLRLSPDDDSEHRSSYRPPVSDSDSEWDIPTPCSSDEVDAFTSDAIKREDKLGILALNSNTLFLPVRKEELYVEEHGVLSPFTRAGDPLDADAVVEGLRALRTAYSLPSGSPVKDESAALHELFSPEKESGDKVKVEAEGWGALVVWGVSRVVDYFSPTVSI